MQSLSRALAALLLTASALAGQTPAAPQPPGSPRFEEGACPFDPGAKVLRQLRCGYLTVPENRAAPDGRQLRLAVAILRSLSPAPRPDPLVMIQGGPGQKLVEYAPAALRSGAMDHLRAEREVIFYDQRGTGYSEPRFCPELSEEWERIPRMGLPPGERLERQRNALARCREEVLREGVDLSQYNSSVNAADLEDLRRALGYPEWNLLAASYGTRAALAAMRRAPEGIRSVVLDGPVPPDEPLWADRPMGLTDVVRRLLARCAADAACSSAFPDVERSLWAGLEEMERLPLVVRAPDGSPDSLVLNGNLYANSVFQALYSRRTLPLVPLLAHGGGGRDEAVMAALAPRLVGGPGGQVSIGLQFAVTCFDEAPLNTEEVRARSRRGVPSVLSLTDAQTDPSLCDALHPYRAGPEHLQPVQSDVPTLIFTGEFDPSTHRSFGPLVAGTLRNAQVVEIPNAGHTESLGSECTRTIMRDFLNDPTRKADTACLASLPPLRFTTDPGEIVRR